MARSRAQVGEVYIFRVLDGRFGACQVIAEQQSGREPYVEVAMLDYLKQKPPTLAVAKGLRVLRQDWASWRGQPARVIVPARVPWWVELVGVLPVLETFEDRCGAHGHWQLVLGAWYRDRWKAREKVKAAAKPIDVEGVTKHPTMERYRYDGSDERFIDFVVQRKLETVHWKVTGLKTLDLSRSLLTHLTLEIADEPLTLRLPDTLVDLAIFGPAHRVTVAGGAFAFPFRLRILSPRVVGPPRGMEAVQLVEYSGLHETDSSALSKYSQLAELTLRGAPGYLRDARGLAKLNALRELALYELYDLDVAHWPASWPALERVEVQGLEQTDAAALKKALKGVASVDVRLARSAKWVEANLGNPLRGWEDDNRAFGRAAGAAWKKAKTAAMKAGAKAKKSDAKTVLETFVKTLNRLGEKQLIDTIRRDEAAAAFLDIARGMGIADADAENWFDAVRDF